MLGGFAMGSSVHRIPYWTELGFDPQLVSLAFSTDAAGAAVMILAVGLLLERFPPRFVAAGAYGGLAVASVLMLIATNALHLFTSTTLFGISIGTTMVSQTYLWASYYGRAFLGTIRGITMPITMLAIAAGAPVAGYIYDFTGGYELAWQIAIVAYISAFVIMLCATPPKRGPEPS
jgi:predicted MFS family arabinose efflux permease